MVLFIEKGRFYHFLPVKYIGTGTIPTYDNYYLMLGSLFKKIRCGCKLHEYWWKLPVSVALWQAYRLMQLLTHVNFRESCSLPRYPPCRVADPVHFHLDPANQNFKNLIRILLALAKNPFKQLKMFHVN